MKKKVFIKSYLLFASIIVYSISGQAQNLVRNTGDLLKVKELKKYVDAHPLHSGQTNSAVERLKRYEKELSMHRSAPETERRSSPHKTHLVPVNDDCINAVMLSENNTCVTTTGDVDQSTQSIPPDSCNGGISIDANDVWYKFVAVTANPYIKVEGSSLFDAIVFLFDSCGGTILGCSDYSFTGGVETIYSTGLIPGHTYFIRVYSYGTGFPSTTTFDICVVTADPMPVNDECANAVMLVENSTCSEVQGTVSGATESMPADSCHEYLSPASNDVWYKFVAVTSSPYITVSGSPAFDPVVFLLDSCGGSIVDCADITLSGGIETIFASGLTPGNTYTIRIYHYENAMPATPGFSICVYSASPVPPNDSICNATQLLLDGPAETGNSAFASFAEYPVDSTVSALGYTCSTPENTTWYFYTAATTDTFYVSYTASGNFISLLGVFTSDNSSAPCQGNLHYDSCLAGPAASGNPVTDVFAIAPAIAGTTYLFMVDGWLASVGPYEIKISSFILTDVKNTINEKSKISIFPNPSNGLLNIDFGIMEKKSTVRIVDLLGNLMAEQVDRNVSNTMLNISFLPSGIYFVGIENETGTVNRKIVLNK